MSTLVLFAIILLLGFIIFNLKQKLYVQKQRISELTKWHKIALTDALTQIPNRMAYSKQIQELGDNIFEKINVSIILFDIDKFKQINDTNGHLTGDMVLKRCADMLCEVFNSKDSCVYRIGGDEFAVILKNVSEEYVIDKLLKVREYENSGLGFKLSKGYSCSNGKKDFLKMFDRADEMLYVDKFSRNK